MDCIFCKIIEGKIPAKKLFEDQEAICIQDAHPQAKTHLLLMPKKHFSNLSDLTTQDPAFSGRLLEKAVKIATEQGLMSGGFRTVINTGTHGGQTVFHLHIHILGGETLRGGFA